MMITQNENEQQLEKQLKHAKRQALERVKHLNLCEVLEVIIQSAENSRVEQGNISYSLREMEGVKKHFRVQRHRDLLFEAFVDDTPSIDVTTFREGSWTDEAIAFYNEHMEKRAERARRERIAHLKRALERFEPDDPPIGEATALS